ncbi:LysR family substrate-binding domain-containing protein [Pseudonocardia sp. KRD-169]|uniref:LysR family substrate-binding domain-containing protein n=1 Tax=Pseudonocardia abyssalis TaxID=2792008 RepID=A0ABS6V1L2_9PSEU|nr:LysR family substrate-binding domain-containing protein [Pseudonocardia abyssalis]MBW0138409.1 LysR family substrate-binding domain-containing protein [Pseudonocardia abyssalis]
MREQHPLIDLDLRPGRYGTAAVAELFDNESDLALTRFAEPPLGVASRSVARDRCVVAVPVRHRLADAGEVRIADFRDEPFVASPESFGSVVRATLVERCQAAGFAPRFAQPAPDSWTATALVSAGSACTSRRPARSCTSRSTASACARSPTRCPRSTCTSFGAATTTHLSYAGSCGPRRRYFPDTDAASAIVGRQVVLDLDRPIVGTMGRGRPARRCRRRS